MGKKCSVIGCKGGYQSELKQGIKVTVFGFPNPKTEPERFAKFLNACGREGDDGINSKCAGICARHFRECDIESETAWIDSKTNEFKSYKKDRVCLRAGAVPTLNIHNSNEPTTETTAPEKRSRPSRDEREEEKREKKRREEREKELERERADVITGFTHLRTDIRAHLVEDLASWQIVEKTDEYIQLIQLRNFGVQVGNHRLSKHPVPFVSSFVTITSELLLITCAQTPALVTDSKAPATSYAIHQSRTLCKLSNWSQLAKVLREASPSAEYVVRPTA
eukprot:comp14316_c0_seq1/m.10346 comp14316_c0_seq1/g.10346  ORF comp14316_c0_seq1/g.10346 comp14316_c0_seq1/m.10346 type:complete len:279 (-) comp14316_c0_seq1:133-969(-)